MGTKVQSIKKGDTVIAIRSGKSRYNGSSFKTGAVKTVAAVEGQRLGYYGSTTPSGYFQTAGGGMFLVSDFKVCTALQEAEALLAAAKARVLALEAKVQDLKNPPWKVGEKFTLTTSGSKYIIHSMDAKYVVYTNIVSNDVWVSKLDYFKKTAKRL